MKETPITFSEMLDHLEAIHNGDPANLRTALDAAMEEITKACVTNNKQATMTLKVTVKQGRANELQVGVDLTTKEPKPSLMPSQFFLDSRGRIYLEDPKQPKLAAVVSFQQGE